MYTMFEKVWDILPAVLLLLQKRTNTASANETPFYQKRFDLKEVITMKKRFTAIAAAASLLCTVCACPVSAEDAERYYVMGDYDGDLQVGVEDAQQSLMLYTNALARNADNIADADHGAADIDMDGQITVKDAQSILDYYCMTMAGQQPLWAEFRECSYATGEDAYGHYDDDGNFVPRHNAAPFPLTGLYVEIGCAQGAPGETVTVPVYIAGASALAGLMFSMNYPADLPLTQITCPLPAWDDDHTDNFIANTDNGRMIWVNKGGRNIALDDGYQLGTYYYTIPEDAQSGAIYKVTVDTTHTDFVTTDGESYQYTLLNGVVVVK